MGEVVWLVNEGEVWTIIKRSDGGRRPRDQLPGDAKLQA